MRTRNIGVVLFAYICVVSPGLAQNNVVVVPLGENIPLRIYYGSVRSVGSLETGNIQSSSRGSEGVYNLEFGASVTGCAVTVTKGSQGGGLSNIAGNINAAVPSSGTEITVRTRDGSLTLDDTDFHFIAVCPRE